ncbi:hypothetical protein QPK87_27415 [Kamptonema cortianum]|nr:hypothetical protein [Kamptonema cortianum]
MIQPTRHLLLLVIILCTQTSSGIAQKTDSPIPSSLHPELAEVFPIEEKDGYVVLTKTILLGEQGVIEKGTILLNLHAPVLKTQRDVRIFEGKDRLQGSYSRGRGIRDNPTEITPQQRASNKRATETEWTQSSIFIEALRFASRNPLAISYVDPEKQTIETAPLMLFEGMFLVEENGKIKALAVAEESRAGQAGFMPGDIITSLGDKEFKAGMKEFVEEYALAKKNGGSEIRGHHF